LRYRISSRKNHIHTCVIPCLHVQTQVPEAIFEKEAQGREVAKQELTKSSDEVEKYKLEKRA